MLLSTHFSSLVCQLRVCLGNKYQVHGYIFFQPLPESLQCCISVVTTTAATDIPPTTGTPVPSTAAYAARPLPPGWWLDTFQEIKLQSCPDVKGSVVFFPEYLSKYILLQPSSSNAKSRPVDQILGSDLQIGSFIFGILNAVEFS